MCGGDDHLAWIGSSFSVWICHLGSSRRILYLVFHALELVFILGVDLSSWVRVEDISLLLGEIETWIGLSRSSAWDDLDSILVASLPAKFRMPDIERYTGVGCPCIHLRLYSTVMRVHGGLIRDPRGKFKPNWSGPYFIRELTLEGAAWLMDLDGRFSSRPMWIAKEVLCLRPWSDSVVFGLSRSRGITHFIWRFMGPHGLARSSSLTGCSLGHRHDRYLIMILQRNIPKAIQLGPPFSALGCHHASPSERYILDHGCDSVMDSDDQDYMFDDR
ncbi:hypothetical protein AAG906_035175 [Vitis piasezkii]